MLCKNIILHILKTNVEFTMGILFFTGNYNTTSLPYALKRDFDPAPIKRWGPWALPLKWASFVTAWRTEYDRCKGTDFLSLGH